MKNRTHIRDIKDSVNYCVFGFVQTFLPPKRTVGSDYRMILTIMDESTTEKLVVCLFLNSLEHFPKNIIEKETIVKIDKLNAIENKFGMCYLIDRQSGCFFFTAARKGVEFVPYFKCTETEYVEGPEDKKALQAIYKHFINEIAFGPTILCHIAKEGYTFSTYGYVKDILYSDKLCTIVVCDPSTEKELRVRLWERPTTEEVPKKDSCVCLYNLKVKKIAYNCIVVDISKSIPFIWTNNVPEEIKMLLTGYRTLHSEKFINTVIQRIMFLQDALEEELKPEQNLEKPTQLFSTKRVKHSTVVDSTEMDTSEDPLDILENAVYTNTPLPVKKTGPDPITRNNPKEEIEKDKELSETSLPKNIAKLFEDTEKYTAEPCSKEFTLADFIAGKKYLISFCETDRIYDELIQLPIKAYHTNLKTQKTAFDSIALSLLDEQKADEEIHVQHAAFYKKIPIIFHTSNRLSDISCETAGYLLFLPTKNPVMHVFLYKDLE